MIKSLRKAFNKNFTIEKYNQYVHLIEKDLPEGALTFRVGETPIFVDKEFKNKILNACESIVDIIVEPDFIEKSAKAISNDLQVPNDKNFSEFIVFDFGICENEDGVLEPQLIEMQGFPSLFGFQAYQDIMARKVFDIPDNFSVFLNGYNQEKYVESLRKIIVGNHKAENVILLEILPHEQKTKIDFYCTKNLVGINVVCLTELIEEDGNLFYMNDGVKTAIHRIYNRIIFDDLQKQNQEIQEKGKLLFKPLNVEWAPHPNWFYRISKYTLPFIKHAFVPATYFLHEVKAIPTDLENYVLKPLFSFSGQGVIIDVSVEDIKNIADPQNWILQRKVKYAEIIETPDVPAKAEIRIFYFWEEGTARPIATCNLARLSKGKMIGVRYNQDKEWVGSSLAYFEND